jgi:hypothetical protein
MLFGYKVPFQVNIWLIKRIPAAAADEIQSSGQDALICERCLASLLKSQASCLERSVVGNQRLHLAVGSAQVQGDQNKLAGVQRMEYQMTLLD